MMPGCNSRGRWWAVVLAVGSALPSAAGETRREQALHHWDAAVADRQSLEALSESEQTPEAYEKLIESFRRVILTSAQSSKADDSLFAVAEIYAAMGRRFGAPYDQKAADAYRVLIRQYPHSPLSAQARKILAEPEKTAPAETAPASPPAKAELSQVNEVRHWSLPGLTRVIVTLDSEVPVHSEKLSNPDRVFFDLPHTRLSQPLKGKTIPVGDDLVKQVRLAHTQIGVTRIVLDLKADLDHAISTLTNPPRIVVEVKPRPAEAKVADPALAPAPKMDPPKPAALAKAAQANSRGERNLIRALGLKMGRVVIDAGHGGHDTGTVGPSGLMEKDLVLDVATRLGALISDRIGSEVIFTRGDDTFVPLEERTALANEKQADLFLSIHANSSRLPTARGIETYYLNLTADREALEVAARENAAAQRSIHDLQDLVSKITLTEKIAESREFATQVQRSLFGAMSRDNSSLRNRGVRKAPFVVLIGARMPSVLAEISFLSNPRDERLLKTPAYRQKLAEALFQGVASYSRTLSRVEVAAK